MKAQKLKSGSTRYQVYAGKDENGKSKYVSFTHPIKEEAERLALEFKLHHKKISRDAAQMTVGEAMDRYIKTKDSVLSPTTIVGYKRIRDNCLQGIINIPLRKLNQEDIQQAINTMAKTKSPKYVRNAHGFLSAVLTTYHPQLLLRTTLPQRQPYEPKIPSENDIKRIIEATRETVIELPILLALWFGLRLSEVCGIEWSAINGNVLTIKQARVYADKDLIIKKTTKSKAGNRKLLLPPYMVNAIERQQKDHQFITPLTGRAIYKRFIRICKKEGLPHFTLHSLRHANASIMLALNIPDKYAMERGGGATNHTMKNVYQHTMSEQRIAVDNKINTYFENIISHEISHDEQN